MHTLVRLVQIVRLWGPLHMYSMFSFENVNGYIGTTYHGTSQILKQIVFELRLKQSLPNILEELSAGETPTAKAYIEKLIHPNHHSNMVCLLPNIYAIGNLTQCHLAEEEVRAVRASRIVIPSSLVTRFSRCMIKGVIYNTTSFSKENASTNNTVCTFLAVDGSIHLKSFFISSQTEWLKFNIQIHQ